MNPFSVFQQNQSHPCPICNTIFATSSELKGHIRSHTELSNHMCRLCCKVFRRNCDLRRHQLLHNHGNVTHLHTNDVTTPVDQSRHKDFKYQDLLKKSCDDNRDSEGESLCSMTSLSSPDRMELSHTS